MKQDKGTSLQTFWDMLESFDWYFEFTDDHEVWKAGHDAQARLDAIATQSKKHATLYEKFRQHKFSGGEFNIAQKPKPKRPKRR